MKLFEKNVDNIADYFEKIIAATSLKKVRFIPLLDTGKTDFGYQVMIRTGDTESYNYLPKSGYYEVSLSDSNNREILKHIAYLITSGKCAFVMKEWDAIKIDNLQEYLESSDTVIGAWDRFGVLRPDQIYSVQNSNHNLYLGFTNFHIEIDSYSTSFRPSSSNWLKEWKYPFAFSSSSGSTSDLSRYMTSVLKNEVLRKILDL